MNITIELYAGNNSPMPRKKDIQKNIDAINRAIKGEKTSQDDILLMDTRSILVAIQDKL
jgi:hypothetical protein